MKVKAMERKLSEYQEEKVLEAGKAYAAAYLLMTVAMDYVDSGDGAVKAAGFHRNDIKQECGRVHKQFDRFCQSLRKYIGQGDSRVILRDYEEIKPRIEKVMEVEL